MVERRRAATPDRRLMHEPPLDDRTGVASTPADTATSHDGALHPNDQLGSVKLPKGGGAIRGLDEKFSVNPSTGTATLTLPIAVSPGRSGLGPQLALSYDSGAGNGPFGFGWSLGLPVITRKTDKGLPRYLDVDESDVFILSGAEDLVPVLDHAGNRLQTSRTVNGVRYLVAPYRPRIEGLFARVERWTTVDSDLTHWRSITRDNVTTLYGFDPGSRIADPHDPCRIFAYLICRTFDDRGNLAAFEYVPEDGTGVDTTQAHESNRTPESRSAQRYLKRIRYAAAQPYLPDWSADAPDTALPDEWYLELVLDYGDHTPDAPSPVPDRPWPVRPDPFSTARPGFEVRTYRRCVRALVFHHFPDEPGVGANCLVRSTDFRYSDQDAPTDPRNPIYTFLTSATQTGYRRSGTGYVRKSMPALEFEYSQPRVQPDVLTLDSESQDNLPEGLAGARYQWLDLDGEGLAGILIDFEESWGYKRNLSPLNRSPRSGDADATRALFGPLEMVSTIPSRSDLGSSETQFLDLSGNGQTDLVAFDGPLPGFFERTKDASWTPFQTFAALPDLDWHDPNLRFVDLTGDGLADLLITNDNGLTMYPSLGEEGFGDAVLVRPGWDEERGPRIVFADGEQAIYLADMSGDGLGDIVRLRNGYVCYWPNLGYGRFGAKVTMDHAPRFTDQERFDPRRIRLADIDGTGTADLLYVGDMGVLVSFNRSGNAWAEPHQLAVFPSADDLSAVQVLDLLGSGTACLVWSSPLPSEQQAPLRYVDLMGGQKPHLLTRIRNNLGAERRLRYAPSTRFYLEDKQNGRPWITRLPYPVHVMERVEVFDWIGRGRFVTRYAYHHGHFDGYEREFRGFGMVEQWDTEEFRDDTDFPEADAVNWDAASWTAPVRTRTWFHTGAYTESDWVSRQYTSEYWIEPTLRIAERAADREAMLLPDTVLPDGLTPEETREAYRALKGTVLRTEIYAEDDTPRAAHPYLVTEQNYSLRLLQPRGINQHAVFYSHPREKLTFTYERQPDDPRVTHDLTLEVDDFGNVLRGLTVGYPRRQGSPAPEPALSPAFQGMLAYDQSRLHIMATESRFTNAVDDATLLPDSYRVPLPASRITAELTGLTPASNRPGITSLFRFDELDALWSLAWDGGHDVPSEEIPNSDVDGSGSPESTPTRRIMAQERTLYRRDDLSGLLSLGQLQPMALPGETYRLALTPSLITRVFDNLVPDATLIEGGYVRLPDSDGWWIPSGRIFYSTGDTDSAAMELTAARAHFYLPRRAVDPFGAVSRVGFDTPYDLLPIVTTDPVGNTTTATNDYRLLRRFRVTDPNGNRVEVASDTLGLVVGSAVMGKETESLGDSLVGFEPDIDEPAMLAHFTDPLHDPATLLGGASSRMLYDLFAYARTRDTAQPEPLVIYTLTRETHLSDLAANETTRYQHLFVYSDGFGREMQRKALAKPGPAAGTEMSVDPRWVGSGWTIFNNKGKPVHQYEPFFTATHRFEFARQVGVGKTLFYDPPGRLVATLHPDNTWEKTVFDAWRQEIWDVNDTVLIADPRTDADVGDDFRRLLGEAANAFTPWHGQRIGGTFGSTDEERVDARDAAQKTEAHAGTTAVVHFDALGRGCLTVADNGGTDRHPTRVAYDTESRPLAVIDALGRHAVEYCRRESQNGVPRYVAGYDLAGNLLYRNGMDDGLRRSLANVADNPLRQWDAPNRAFRMRYDPAQRRTHRYASVDGAPEILLERSIYGEGHPDLNLCGRLFRQYDTAGVASNERYDFKGNLVTSARQFAREYRQSVDWSPLAELTSTGDLDTAAAPLLIAADHFVATTIYDALNRPIQTTSPHREGMPASVVHLSYSESAQLDSMDVNLRGAAATTSFVTGIDHNARGQRERITYQNRAATRYDYDPFTFRLANLRTTRPASPNGLASQIFAAPSVVQDLHYTYDPTGNLTRIADAALATVFHANQRVDPIAGYTYDARYRLIQAEGREQVGQSAIAMMPVSGSRRDYPFAGLSDFAAHPNDIQKLRRYSEQYVYDAADNFQQMRHQADGGAWTRHYDYGEESLLEPGMKSNRLTRTRLGNGQNLTESYRYTDAQGADVRGCLTAIDGMTMDWDIDDRLRQVDLGGGGTAHYVYDSSGQRVRKVIESQNGTRRQERYYLGGLEVYREYGAGGETVVLERETLHLMDDTQRLALVETQTVDNGTPIANPVPVQRYQLGNHLDSASLELDENAALISYEEYGPYGTTTFQAERSAAEISLKRYRFTAMERDEESGLYYHGARYFVPWLGRWSSCDPVGVAGGLNPYAYVLNNPLRLFDPLGTQPQPAVNLQQDEEGNYILPEEIIEIHGSAPPPDDLEMARRNGLVDVVSRDEFERELTFDEQHNSSGFWTMKERIEYWQQFPEEWQEEWNRTVSRKYEAYREKKAAEWDEATRRMDAAAHIGNVIAGGTIALIGVGTGVAQVGFLTFGKQMLFGAMLAGATSSGDFTGCGRLAGLGGGAIRGGTIPGTTSVIAEETATAEALAAKLGISTDDLALLKQGELVFGNFARGETQATAMYSLEGDTLTAGMLKINTPAGASGWDSVKSFLAFKNGSMDLARSLGASTLRLEGNAVLNPDVEKLLLNWGYVEYSPGNFYLNVPVR